jgi:hypothetical protein
MTSLSDGQLSFPTTSRIMSAPELYGGIGSLVVGLLCVVFPKPIGIGFRRIGKWTWKGHENDVFGKAIPFLSRKKIYNETEAPKIFRLLGIVFLIQAVVFFILSAVT